MVLGVDVASASDTTVPSKPSQAGPGLWPVQHEESEVRCGTGRPCPFSREAPRMVRGARSAEGIGQGSWASASMRCQVPRLGKAVSRCSINGQTVL
jgi:hypothetical protein